MKIQKWSSLQEDVYLELDSGKNLFLHAVAGSGKSTTLFEVANRLLRADPNTKTLFLCFNKSVQTHAEIKLGNTHIECRTFHSFGFKVMRELSKFVRNDSYKISNIIGKYFPRASNDDKQYNLKIEHFYTVKKVVDWIRQYNIPLDKTLIKTSIETQPSILLNKATGRDTYERRKQWCLENIQPIIDIVKESDTCTDIIDMTDMVRQPSKLSLVNRYCKEVQKYDNILIDEAQDIDSYQLSIISQIAENGTRVIMVGDEFQSIYGFRGALKDIVDTSINTFSMKKMPLSITYRCSKEISDYVNEETHSKIESYREGGTVKNFNIVCESLSSEDSIKSIIEIIKERRPNFIIAPTNRILVNLWIGLFKQGIPSTFKDRKIVQALLKIWRDCESINKLREVLYKSINEEKDGEMILPENQRDIYEAFYDFIESFDIRTNERLKSALDKLAEQSNSIYLHTVHSSKGLEEETVMVIHNWFPTPDLINMKYVAMTRAIGNLINIHKKELEDIPEEEGITEENITEEGIPEKDTPEKDSEVPY